MVFEESNDPLREGSPYLINRRAPIAPVLGAGAAVDHAVAAVGDQGMLGVTRVVDESRGEPCGDAELLRARVQALRQLTALRGRFSLPDPLQDSDRLRMGSPDSKTCRSASKSSRRRPSIAESTTVRAARNAAGVPLHFPLDSVKIR